MATNGIVQINQLEWDALNLLVTVTQEQIISLTSRVEAAEIEHVKLDTELSTLEQIVKNRTTPEAKQAIEHWFASRRKVR